MSVKWCALTLLCALTVTACTHPVDRAIQSNAAYHEKSFEYAGKISSGACDDVGQLIPSDHATVFEASAAPSR